MKKTRIFLLLASLLLLVFVLASCGNKGNNDPTDTTEAPVTGTPGLVYTAIEDDTAWQVSGYEGTALSVVIPATYEGKPVKKIGYHAFDNHTTIVSVTMPDSLTTIEGWAFNGCVGLSGVTFGGSLVSIGEFAFWGCDSLVSVTIPDSVTQIGRYAFAYSDALISVTLGSGVARIGESAFFFCENLGAVSFSATAGWSMNGTAIPETGLANAATAATYLTQTYCYDTWVRQ